MQGVFCRIAFSMALLAAATAGRAAVKPIEAPAISLPAVWATVSAQDRLAAVRVAELDAARLLMERICGLELDADTAVGDFALIDDQVRGELFDRLLGISTVGAPEYRPDGQVWVTRQVKLRQVYEIVTATFKERQLPGRARLLHASVKTAQTNEDTVVDVLGNGAIPGSDGLRKIQAKRAAEMDAYRQLAEKIDGVQIAANTSVRDFALESDDLRASIATQIVRGAKPVEPDGIVYLPDGSCDVKLEIKLAEIYRTIKARSKKWPGRDEEAVRIEHEVVTRVIRATGHGAPRPAGEVATLNASKALLSADIVSRTLVGRAVVIE